MSLPTVLDAFERSPSIRDLAGRLPSRSEVLRLGGLPGSSGAVLAAWLAQRFPQRLLAIVAPTPGDADRWLTDLGHLTDGGVALYPQREALGEEEPHYEIAGERAETIEALLQGRLRVLVTTARATAERTLVPAALERLRLKVAHGERRPPGDVARALERMGYRRVPTVTEVAEFSVRGGILDMYGFGMAVPARLEWWGDDVSSIRGFDLTTQRSLQELTEITVLPVRTDAVRGRSGSRGPGLPSHAPRSAPVGHSHSGRGAGPGLRRGSASMERGGAPSRRRAPARRGGPQSRRHSVTPETWTARLEGFPRLLLRDEQRGSPGRILSRPRKMDRDIKRLRALLAGTRRRSSSATTRASASGSTSCSTRTAGRRRRAALVDRRAGRRLRHSADRLAGLASSPTTRSSAASGASVARGGTSAAHRRSTRWRSRRATTSCTSSTASASIAASRRSSSARARSRSRSSSTRAATGSTFRSIASISSSAIAPPTTIGDDAPPPRLHKLGGKRWAQQRDRTRAAIQEMTVELLDLYARRKIATRPPHVPDTRVAAAARVGFLFEDTPDQRKATDDVKRRHGEHAADGPPARRRRRLRQDRDRRARRVQGGAGRAAGRGARADDDSRRPARAHVRRAPRRFSDRVAALRRFQTREGAEGGARRARGEKGRHRHRHAPAAQPRRRRSPTSASSSSTRSIASA